MWNPHGVDVTAATEAGVLAAGAVVAAAAAGPEATAGVATPKKVKAATMATSAPILDLRAIADLDLRIIHIAPRRWMD